MLTSNLELRWAKRQGGEGRTEREYCDFFIDGRSLRVDLGAPDCIGGIGWGPPEAERQYIDRLLLLAPADAPSGRVSLYICPECGDLGCGAITVRVQKTEDHFVWSGFAFENNYDPEMSDMTGYTEIGPFAFSKAEYWSALNACRRAIDENSGRSGEV